MKKSTLALVCASLAGLSSSNALAQSSVTIYGTVDTSMRYLSSDNGRGNSNIKLEDGAVAHSNIGLKGIEDLGGGNKVLFRLENGFNPDTGAMSVPGSIFNRHAWVGVSGSYGQLSFGRQTTLLSDMVADYFDPLTFGNYDTISWLPAGGTLVRSSNMLKYTGNFAGLSTGLSWAMGQQAGSLRRGSQLGMTLQYTSGAFSLGGGYQQTMASTNADNKHRVYNLNASFDLGQAKLFAGYFNIRDCSGKTTTTFAAANSTAAMIAAETDNGLAGIPGITRKDDGYFFGLNFKPASTWTLTAAAYYDKSRDISLAGIGNLGNGSRYTLVGMAEYALSKRTQLYGIVDYNKAKDAAMAELPGANSVTGIGLGIRHAF